LTSLVAGPSPIDGDLPRLTATRRAALRSLLRDGTAVLGLVIVALLASGAVLAPLIAPHDPDQVDVLRKFSSPSAEFPLGTDNLGRDVLSRLLFGGRISIGACLVAGLLVGVIGTAVGLVAGYRGGVVDGIVGRSIDLLLAFPPFLLAMAVLGLVGPGLRNLTLVLVAVEWALYARIVRSAVLVERQKEYVDAARASGASSLRVMARHVLPNIVAPIVVLVTLDMGIILLEISGLSFLGLGVSPPTAEWGAMLSEGRTYLSQAPQMMLFPGLAIFLLVLGFNLVGDGLRDALDPHTRRLLRGRRRRHLPDRRPSPAPGRGVRPEGRRRPPAEPVSPKPTAARLTPATTPLPTERIGDGVAILSVRGLTVSFGTQDGVVRAVDGLSYDVYPNEVLGIVGESGSGKSVSSLAVMALLPDSAVVEGEVIFRGQDLLRLPEKERRTLRGSRLAIVSQDALGALNPVFTIGNQVAEAVTAHQPRMGKAARRSRAIDLLDLVGIPNPSARIDQYPHEFSGGMRQRAMIAMAIANEPDVLIADEPTTALDVTIQAQVLEVLARIKERTSSAIVLITHDLGIVAGMADRVLVMYAGRPAETGAVDEIFCRPRHPYTMGLLASLPRLDGGTESRRLYRIKGQPPSLILVPSGCPFHPRCDHAELPGPCAVDRPTLELVAPTGTGVGGEHRSACHLHSRLTGLSPGAVEPEGPAGNAGGRANSGHMILEVRGLVKDFPVRTSILKRVRSHIHAVSGVSFDLADGETLALVGESGCGKSTTGRMVLRLLDPTAGTVRFDGEELVGAPAARIRSLRRRMQIVFQDPYASLNPRMTVRGILSEPMRVHGTWRKAGPAKVDEVMDLVGLNPEHLNRYPHEFSGGQRQRIGIARALVLEPALLVLDEPVSALDVSIQAGILNLLEDVQDRLGLAYLFIAHDLSVVRHIADRVAIMYLGRIVEIGTRADVYNRPAHPYTQALLSAVPVPDPARERRRRRIVLEGDVPSPATPPSGCRFRTRCWKAQDVCATDEPGLIDRGQGHPVACHFAEVTPVI